MIMPGTRIRNLGFDWDPFSELQRLTHQVDQWLGGPARETRFPAVNLWSNDEQAVVTAEVPGVNREDLALTVIGTELTLEGERKAEAFDENDTCHRRERATGRFVRTVHLPFEVEQEQAQATYRNGILRVVMPRKESTKPRKISVSGE
jgi:HSP20 family protein